MDPVAAIIRALVLLLFAGAWIWTIVDCLRLHRPWRWLLIVLLLPVVSIPFYLYNFRLGHGESRGRIDSRLQDNQKLRELQQEAAERDVPAVHRQIAEIHIRYHRWEEALTHLGRVLDRDPEDLRAQYLAGTSLTALEKHDAAIPHLEYVVEEDPNYSRGDARVALATALGRSGRREEAIGHLEGVVSGILNPEASVRLARLLADEGQVLRAREELTTMLQRVGELPKDRKVSQKRWIRQAAEDLRKLPASGDEPA